ncbi:MAG: TrmH family RNA methyltransferase [Gammaproteobacteria bacterium]
MRATRERRDDRKKSENRDDRAPRQTRERQRDASEKPPRSSAPRVRRRLRSDFDGDILVCGRRAVSAAISAGRTRRVWIDERGGGAEDFARRARDGGAEIAFASAAEITALLGESAHQGIAAAAAPPPAEWEKLLAAAPAAPLVVLDGVTDPRNLGAVMRAARAFSAVGVVAPHRRSAPLSAAAAKASTGAAAFLPLYRAANLRRALSELRAAGWTIIGASEKAETSAAADLPFPACWVFGDEGGGLRRLTAESCDFLVRLPTAAGGAGCLNVAAACAACLAISAARNRLPE